jgi:hypothetical protein
MHSRIILIFSDRLAPRLGHLIEVCIGFAEVRVLLDQIDVDAEDELTCIVTVDGLVRTEAQHTLDSLGSGA